MNCETLVVTEENFETSVERMRQGHCGADLRHLSLQRRIAFNKALDKPAEQKPATGPFAEGAWGKSTNNGGVLFD